jgi:mono/diheme cytochrome c family protein
MAPSPRRLLIAAACVAAALALGACGEQGIALSENDPNYEGARLFDENCAGCHTLTVAGAEGSATKVQSRERKDGPNFDDRKEDVDSVLYAIRNGGFSSSPMPQNLVTGEDAQKVAEFVAKYSGSNAR